MRNMAPIDAGTSCRRTCSGAKKGGSVSPDSERRTLERREGPPECNPAHDHARRQHRLREAASAPLLGLAKCGVCAAGFIMAGRNRFACFGAREKGTCSNHLTIRRDEVEARVLKVLEEKLLNQKLFEEFCDEF